MNLQALTFVRIGMLTVFLSQINVNIAVAQTVQVRTGEHPTFTRIVIDFARRPNWRLGQNEGRYELWLDNPNIRFGLNDAFRRLQGRRISDLTDLGDGKLAIELLCECSLNVQLLSNEGLLIDIRNERPKAGDPWSKPLAARAEKKLAGDMYNPGKILPMILPEMRTIPTSGFNSGNFFETRHLSALERTLQSRANLFDEASRAASQGLIALKSLETKPPTLKRSTQLQYNSLNNSSSKLIPNIRVESAYDRDRLSANVNAVGESLSDCLSTHNIAVGQWFELSDVLNSLGAAHENLVDPRDQPVVSAYENLARMLIFLTFGREAGVVLAQVPSSAPQRDILIELAGTIEGSNPSSYSKLASQSDCDTVGALWSILAQSDTTSPGKFNTSAIVREFSAFPVHLRQHLGPRLAERLLEIGEKEAALSVQNSIGRGTVNDALPAIQLLQARLSQTQGNQSAANLSLSAVAGTRSEQAVEALAQLIKNRMSTNTIVSEDEIQRASAIVFELGSNPSVRALVVEIISARLHNSQYQAALSQIDDFYRQGNLDETSARELREATFAQITAQADDETFLSIAMADDLLGAIGERLRLPVAQRFVDLGLVKSAQAVLGESAYVPDENERYILAEIAVIEGKRNVAMSYLTGLESDRAENLRGRAKSIAQAQNYIVPFEANTSVGEDFVRPVDREVSFSDKLLSRNRQLLTETEAMRNNLKLLLSEIEN